MIGSISDRPCSMPPVRLAEETGPTLEARAPAAVPPPAPRRHGRRPGGAASALAAWIDGLWQRALKAVPRFAKGGELSQIRPNLYLGGINSAVDASLLRAKNVTWV